MALIDHDHPLLQPDALAERLALYDLGPDDRPIASRLHEDIIMPSADLLVDQFYARLFRHERLANFVHDQGTRKRLKGTFIHYLETLGVGYEEQTYALQRMQVGLRHAEIGLPLTYYLCAYRILQNILLDHVLAHEARPAPLLGFALKITGYDTSLAVEAYHLIRTHKLRHSIADLRQEKALLTVAANTDPLTRLANRRLLLSELERRCREAELQARPLSLAMIDLDDFKAINDHHGHLCGDHVLTHVGQLLQRGLRSHDLVGRYGGEEFMVILDTTELEQARRVMERIRERLAAQPLRCNGHEIPVRMSVGVALRQPGECCTQLLARADQALYRAKHSGKNRVEVDPGAVPGLAQSSGSGGGN